MKLSSLSWLMALMALNGYANGLSEPKTEPIDVASFEPQFASLGLKVLSAKPSDIQGLLELETNGGLFYVSPNGEYFIAGTLYQFDDKGGYSDVQAKRAAPKNAAKVAAAQKHMLEYPAPNERYKVTVFTDITCGYCVQLHSQMAQYHQAGISVRYLAYPRQGVPSPTAKTMAGVWCSADPQQALNQAMQNQSVKQQPSAECETSIAEQYQLGQQLGISGTPAIVLEDGELVGGYLPPAALLQRLQKK